MSLIFEQRGTREGRDVVLLHGLPSAPASMWHVGEALTSVARVTNIHLAGYDGSPPLRPFDEGKAMDLVIEALAAAHVRAPVFVGFSGGAYRALALALRPSLGARGVVTLGGLHAVSAEHGASLRGSAAAARDPKTDLKAAFTPAFLSPRGLENPAFVAEVGTWFEVADRSDVADELEAFSRLPALDLAPLAVPLLSRVGDADIATPVALTDALLAAATNAPRRLRQIVPGVGHAIMIEDHAATAAAVRDFVLSL